MRSGADRRPAPRLCARLDRRAVSRPAMRSAGWLRAAQSARAPQRRRRCAAPASVPARSNPAGSPASPAAGQGPSGLLLTYAPAAGLLVLSIRTRTTSGRRRALSTRPELRIRHSRTSFLRFTRNVRPRVAPASTTLGRWPRCQSRCIRRASSAQRCRAAGHPVHPGRPPAGHTGRQGRRTASPVMSRSVSFTVPALARRPASAGPPGCCGHGKRLLRHPAAKVILRQCGISAADDLGVPGRHGQHAVQGTHRGPVPLRAGLAVALRRVTDHNGYPAGHPVLILRALPVPVVRVAGLPALRARVRCSHTSISRRSISMPRSSLSRRWSPFSAIQR